MTLLRGLGLYGGQGLTFLGLDFKMKSRFSELMIPKASLKSTSGKQGQIVAEGSAPC